MKRICLDCFIFFMPQIQSCVIHSVMNLLSMYDTNFILSIFKAGILQTSTIMLLVANKCPIH